MRGLLTRFQSRVDLEWGHVAILLHASRVGHSESGAAARIAESARTATNSQPPAAQPLPQTTALEWPEEDLSGRLMDGAHRFVERQIADTQARSERFWKYDRSSPAAWEAALKANRDRLREIIGAVDPRVAPALERYGNDESPAIVAETDRYRVFQVRWPVLDGMTAEGLLVEPAERHALSVSRGRTGCRADSRTDPRSRSRIAA